MSSLDKKIAKLDEKIARLKREKMELEKKRADQLDNFFLEPRDQILFFTGEPKDGENKPKSPEKKKKKKKKKDKDKVYQLVNSSEKDKINYCYKCKKEFACERRLERHNWKHHPSNAIEEAWAKTDWSTFRGSTYYKDDPYY